MTFLLGRAEVERFRELVSRRLGLHFDDGKLDFLGDVLRKRLGATQCPEPASYLDRLGAARAELRAVAQQLTVSETYFFRNADHQRAFVETAVRDRMRARAAQRHLRILSAGCASGEEAYTLAILLRDCVPELEGWNVELRGIDVNPAMIAKAQRARYSAWSLRQTPPEVRDRWFRPAGGEYELVEPVRAMAAFEERNLIEDDASFWRAGAFDVVFCRNVVMYFAPEVVQRRRRGGRKQSAAGPHPRPPGPNRSLGSAAAGTLRRGAPGAAQTADGVPRRPGRAAPPSRPAHEQRRSRRGNAGLPAAARARRAQRRRALRHGPLQRARRRPPRRGGA